MRCTEGTAATGVVFALALLLAAPAVAQQAPEDTLPAPRYELDPMVVQGFGAPIRTSELPFAVSVVTPPEALAGVTLDDVLLAVPGLQVEPRFNFAVGERLSLRGFGSRAQFGVRGARVLVDGLPATFADGQTVLDGVDPARVERVEVVRGPAAAFHGNATAGVVAFQSARPDRTAVEVTGGGPGSVRGELRSGGTAAGWDLRAAGSWLSYGGFRPHSEASVGRASAGASWTGRRDALTLIAHGSRLEARNPGSLAREHLEEDRFQAFQGNVALRTGKTAGQGQVGAVWTRTGSAVVAEASVHGTGRSLENPIPGVIIDLDRAAAGLRAHLRSGPAARVRWQAGVEANGQWDDRRNHANVEGTRGELRLDQAERVRATGPFASVGAPVGPLLVHGSLRYDHVRFAVDDRFGDGADSGSGAREMGAWSPAAGVVLDPDGPVRLFANVSTSFETPTTTELANRPDGSRGFNPELGPQRTRSVEIGAAAGGGALEGEVVAHRAEVRDALVPFQTDGGRDFFRNAGSARHQGVEVAAAVRPGRWHGRVAVSALDARFLDYGPGESDFAGNRVPGAARWSADAFLERDLGWGAARVVTRYRGPVPVDDANTDRAPGHTLVDLALRSRTARRGATGVQGWVEVRNVLDREWIAGVVPNAFGGRFFEPGPGRLLYIGGSVSLGG